MSHASIHRAVATALLAGLLAGTPAVAAYAFEPDSSTAGGTSVAERAADATGQDATGQDATGQDATAQTAEGGSAEQDEAAASQAQQTGTAAPALAPRRAPKAGDDPSQPVATSLWLSDPVPEVSYAGDSVALTATLTDSGGAPVAGKQVKLTLYRPGVSGVPSLAYYQITDADGVASFSVSDLDAGTYKAYAEFLGSQNFNESVFQASGESNTATIAVRPAEEKPAPEQPTPEPGDAQVPTTVSITSYAKNDYYSTQSYTSYDFGIAAYDAEGNPVNDVDGSRNVELHIVAADGTDDVETRTLDPEGKWNDVGKAKITKQLSAGTYEIYVKYIGRNGYASSESPHLSLTVAGVAGGRILEHVAAKEPSVEATGNIEYWVEHGETGDRYFSDEAGTVAVEPQDTVVAKLAPSITAGAGQSVTEGERQALTFRSNAPLADLERVELDGTPLGADLYVSSSGSTLVTLLEDYVASLPVGRHTIAIVSDGGTARTSFEVVAKKAPVTPPAGGEGAGTEGSGTEGSGTGAEGAGTTGSGTTPAAGGESTTPVAQTPSDQDEAAPSPAPADETASAPAKPEGEQPRPAAAPALPTTGDDRAVLAGTLLLAGALLLAGSHLSRRRA